MAKPRPRQRIALASLATTGVAPVRIAPSVKIDAALVVYDLVTGQSRVLAKGMFVTSAMFSLDGKRVAFVVGSGKHLTQSNVWTADSAGRGLKQTTFTPLHDINALWWSPDGARLVFERYLSLENKSQVWSMASDGTDLQKLADNASNPQPTRGPAARGEIKLPIGTLWGQNTLLYVDTTVPPCEQEPPLSWRTSGGRKSNTSPRRISKEDLVATRCWLNAAAKPSSCPQLVHVVTVMETCESHRLGMTRPPARLSSGPTRASVRTTAFVSTTNGWGCVTCTYPRGARFGLSSAATGMPGWDVSEIVAAGIEFTAAGNEYVRGADPDRAQVLADGLCQDKLQRRLDRYATSLYPIGEVFVQTCHRSLMQAE